MRAIGQFQAGNYKASGKSRVMWFPSVAAARAESRLFGLADAIEIDGQSLFYADRLSTVVDDGTSNTPAIKLDAVQLGRFVRAQPYLPSGVYFSAAEDGSDDWIRLAALANTEYGAGGLRRWITLQNGNYRMVQHSEFPIGTRIAAEGPGVVITCYVPAPSTVAPYRGPFVIAPRYVANATTLNAAAAIGDRMISIACATQPQVGQVIVLTSVALGFEVHEGFEIRTGSVSGAGPYTVVTDHPVTYDFATATTSVDIWEANRGYEFIGNGATIRGVSERATSIACAWDCKITGWHVDASQMTEYACSLDTAGGRSEFDDMHVDGVLITSGFGICLEYSHKHKITNSSSHGHGLMIGCWGSDHVIDNVDVVGTAVAGELGILIGHGRGHNVKNASVSGAFSGVEFRNTHGSKLENSRLGGCTIGLSATGAATAPTKAICDNVTVTNSLEGVYRVYANSSIEFARCNMSKAKPTGFLAFSDVGSYVDIVGGEYSLDGSNIGLANYGTLRIRGNARLNAAACTANGQPVIGYSGTLILDGVEFVGSANTVVCGVAIGGTVSVQNCKIVAGSSPVGFTVNAPATLWRGLNADFAGCATPYNGTGARNFGVTALNGAAAVTLPYPPAIASSVVTATRRAFAGATPGPFAAIAAAGVGGTLTGVAGDTSTIEWRID